MTNLSSYRERAEEKRLGYCERRRRHRVRVQFPGIVDAEGGDGATAADEASEFERGLGYAEVWLMLGQG